SSLDLTKVTLNHNTLLKTDEYDRDCDTDLSICAEEDEGMKHKTNNTLV
ncbi:hypothetical protein TNCV_3866931, partial [Trichonephila clavipes]